jgi:hypothetical protein
MRGFGKYAFGDATPPVPDPMNPGLNVGGNSAYDQLASGDYGEWQLGVELSMPLGFRRAHTGVRNAELMLARERAILCDMRNELVRQSADAVAEVDRAYVTYWTSYDRVLASKEQLDALEAKEQEGVEVALHLILDAQKRLAEAESEFHRGATEFAVATKNVHFAKGTLLEYDGIFLNEGSWPGAAHEDAAELEKQRGKAKDLNYASSRAPIVSGGRYAQARGMSRSPMNGSQGSSIELESPAPASIEAVTPGTSSPLVEPLPDVLPPASDSAMLDGPQTLSVAAPASGNVAMSTPFISNKSRAEELAAAQAMLTGPRPPATPSAAILDAARSSAIEQTSAVVPSKVQPTGAATTPPAAPQFVW